MVNTLAYYTDSGVSLSLAAANEAINKTLRNAPMVYRSQLGSAIRFDRGVYTWEVFTK